MLVILLRMRMLKRKLFYDFSVRFICDERYLFFGSHLIEPITVKGNVVLSVELSVNQVLHSLNKPSGSNSF